ncbi:MAG: 50S ribosomal protein L29 [Pseudomonadota bacterium]
MNVEEIRAKSDTELDELLIELRRKQFDQRMQRSSGQPARSHEVTGARRDIARIKTVLNERRAGEEQ